MATYKNINGFPIQYLESDPTNPIAGQVWFNSTSKSLKGHGILGTGAWASGGALNTGTHAIGFFGGTQTAAIVAGGASPPTANVE